ncbi:hypothetical protein HMPREF9012_2140 [Bacteroidetes bacterium oral taxon 272 str. F0290]|nr:hypothetical protein HMPREF9012_2140 [Bacteroidetes bacterium oral taxon 272 str. F0290]
MIYYKKKVLLFAYLWKNIYVCNVKSVPYIYSKAMKGYSA